MKKKGTVTEVERYQGKGVPTTQTEDSHHLQSPSQQAESFQFVHLFNYFYEKSFKVFCLFKSNTWDWRCGLAGAQLLGASGQVPWQDSWQVTHIPTITQTPARSASAEWSWVLGSREVGESARGEAVSSRTNPHPPPCPIPVLHPPWFKFQPAPLSSGENPNNSSEEWLPTFQWASS